MLQLDPPDVLLTVAEIAVAFAGFASLSTIIANKFSGEKLEVAFGRLRFLLGSSLSTIAVAFFPIILIAFELSSEHLWQISAVISVVFLASSSPGSIRRVQAMRRLPGYNPRAGVFMFALMIFYFAAMGLCASGIYSSFDVYLLAICALLSTCGIMFGLVVLTILTERNPSGDDA